MVSGIQKIKVSGSEKRAFARWLEGYAVQSKADYTIYVPFAFRDQILATISCIGMLCFYYIAYRSQLSVAQFTAFISAFGLVSGTINAMGSIGSSFSNLNPALNMGEDILQTLPECTQNLTKVEKITGRVELNEVSFRYSQDTPLILDAVSLLIHPGEYVALVGKSGCGKSTIMKLLLGFEQPVQGTVSLDGMDINKLDNISQNIVTDTLSGMKGTRIVIAHRLSTIKECDRIIAIDQGHIVEEGTYDELMSKKGFFAELVERQQIK